MYIKIVKLETVDSTNNYACKLAELGAKEITVVISKEQSKGKGRMGKYWASPLDKGVYVSFVLRPINSFREIYYLPLAFSLAVARLLAHNFKGKEDIGKQQQIRIKLPNDVMLAGKKVAGILVEAKTTGKKINFVVVGIGINVNSAKADIPSKATSFYLATGKKYNLEEASKSLIKEVMRVYNEFKRGEIKRILEEAFVYQRAKSLSVMEENLFKKVKTSEVVHLI
ncbi:MAG: biotin--[acetyl-CoA-carboxylase] ligase [Candidatus Omnitrophota bacterium]|jgi:BirA family biotin operon repressor/biotin-[acetyl-CoA-carboxylase] ligase